MVVRVHAPEGARPVHHCSRGCPCSTPHTAPPRPKEGRRALRMPCCARPAARHLLRGNQPQLTLRELVQAALILVDGAADGLEHVPAVLQHSTRSRTAFGEQQWRVGGRPTRKSLPMQGAATRPGSHNDSLAERDIAVGPTPPALQPPGDAPRRRGEQARQQRAPTHPGHTLKWSAWLHRVGSHFRHSVPSWSGMGEGSPICSMYAWPSGTAGRHQEGGSSTGEQRRGCRRACRQRRPKPSSPLVGGCRPQCAAPRRLSVLSRLLRSQLASPSKSREVTACTPAARRCAAPRAPDIAGDQKSSATAAALRSKAVPGASCAGVSTPAPVSWVSRSATAGRQAGRQACTRRRGGVGARRRVCSVWRGVCCGRVPCGEAAAHQPRFWRAAVQPQGRAGGAGGRGTATQDKAAWRSECGSRLTVGPVQAHVDAPHLRTLQSRWFSSAARSPGAAPRAGSRAPRGRPPSDGGLQAAAAAQKRRSGGNGAIQDACIGTLRAIWPLRTSRCSAEAAKQGLKHPRPPLRSALTLQRRSAGHEECGS